MRELSILLESITAQNLMTRLAFFPGGVVNVAVYGKDETNYFYDAKNVDEMVKKMQKDWPSTTVTTKTIIAIPGNARISLPSFPPPFPRPM
jgi:hypothetical protein